MISIFEDIESEISKTFTQKFSSQKDIAVNLLGVYESFLKATSGKVKDNDYPRWTVLILLSQTLPLMTNALDLLARGYLRSSEILIRVASEGMILAAYFTEFPEAEQEFRALNYRDFFHKHKIDDMLKRVEKEGKILLSNKKRAKQVKWHKVVFNSLYQESSRFLHHNLDLIYNIALDQLGADKDKGNLILGPQLYTDNVLSMGLRRILNATLFSLVVLGVSLKIIPDDDEKGEMERSQKVIEDLNKQDK